MTYVGGLRARLVHESIYRGIYDALDELGWFDTDRNHLPVQFLSTGVADEEKVAKNTAALTVFDVSELAEEMGSNLTENRWTYYVDFYAENEAIGTHFITDIKDIVGGRFPSISRDGPYFDVWDYTQATPTQIFTVQIEEVMTDRPSVYERPWQRYFRVCRFDVIDVYGDEND